MLSINTLIYLLTAMHTLTLDVHTVTHHHRHQHDTQHSAKASHHCDCPPVQSILHQLQGLSHCDTCDMTDLVNPGGGWPTHRHVSISVMAANRLSHWSTF